MTSATLVFATRNAGKVVELRELLADLAIEIRSIDEIVTAVPEVVEDGDSFLENAEKKARAVSQATGHPALADDSGLEVDALGGRPGIYSARFAGTDASDEDNNAKLLASLRGVVEIDRSARFRSALVFADCAGRLGDETLTAEGVCEGRVLTERRGTGGFGYDPLFFVPELGKTFAELGIGTKNDRSHRAMAMRVMKGKLAAYYGLAKGGSSR